MMYDSQDTNVLNNIFNDDTTEDGISDISDECETDDSTEVDDIESDNHIPSDLDVNSEEESTVSKRIKLIPPQKKPTLPITSDILVGKNGHVWYTKGRKTASRNIINCQPAAKGVAKQANTPLDMFMLFFDEEMYDTILTYTNQEIQRKQITYKDRSHFTVSETSKDEIKALIATLILSAAQQDNHLSSVEMFDDKVSGALYKTCFSRDRFNFLINCLRFDDRNTRDFRIITDSFTPIRSIWDRLIENCKSLYTPGPYVTIDGQLVGFLGRCPFKVYSPHKPTKYGIKIIMACDTSTKYVINAMPYLGKDTKTDGQPLAEYFVKTLTEPLHGSHRNITAGNWFSSIPLAKELFQNPYNLTYLGTLRKNKSEIPPELLYMRAFEKESSAFCFDNELTLVSHKSKSNKVIILISTMFEQRKLFSSGGKPEIIEVYNKTKGAVDSFDEMCSTRGCNRKTRRWPLCIFFNMINIAVINSWIVYCLNQNEKDLPPLARKDFMMDLYKALARPWLEKRVQVKNIKKDVRDCITEYFNIPIPETSSSGSAQKSGKRTACKYCPSKLKRMTTVYCNHCQKAICGEHRARCCVNCDSLIDC